MREGRERECLVTNGENKKESNKHKERERERERERGIEKKKQSVFLRRKFFYPTFKVIITHKT